MSKNKPWDTPEIRRRRAKVVEDAKERLARGGNSRQEKAWLAIIENDGNLALAARSLGIGQMGLRNRAYLPDGRMVHPKRREVTEE